MAANGSDQGVGEFDLIARFFAPLAETVPGAFFLQDDAALLDLGGGSVVTTDMMVEGVHFLPGSAPDMVAQKLLRVNLSDLAAMASTPRHYTLALGLSRDMAGSEREAWVKAFADGLARDQEAFGVTLVGGDTVSTPGPLTAAITAFGTPPDGNVVTRAGARPGDRVYVSGTIGDAVLGLGCLLDGIEGLDEATRTYLVERHRLPTPRLSVGAALGPVARAMTDVSDGLLQDLSHIARVSGVDFQVEQACVPLSPAARVVLDRFPERSSDVLVGGDDYELVFVCAPDQADAVEAVARQTGVPLTLIGRVAPGEGRVRLLDAGGADITPEQLGFSHF